MGEEVSGSAENHVCGHRSWHYPHGAIDVLMSLHRRVRDGKELPKTRSDCQVMMMGDPTGISMNAFA